MWSLDKLLATTVLAAGMTLVAGGMAFAQTAPGNPTTQQMIEQLKPHTRGLIIGGSSAPPPAAAPATPETRGLIVGGGSPPAPATTTVPPASTGMAPPVAPARPYTPPVAAIPSTPAPMATPSRPVAPPATVMATPAPMPAAKPSLNLRVLFAFNSADLTPEAKTTLDNLGRALQSNDLKNSRFEVAGHTDAVGDDAMNRKLSEDRAAAVKNYLVTTYGIEASRIQSVGHGKAELFDPAHPTSPINRRVQVTNLSAAG